MKDIIIVTKKGGENKKLLAIKNVNKTTMMDIAKVLSAIDLKSKYSWAISNTNIDTTGNLGLIGIIKYWRRASQI